MIRERNIATNLILTIITCGIYGIVWFITLTDDAAQTSDDTMSGGMSFLLNIITCGIYGFYWAYKMGKMIKTAGDNKDIDLNDNSVLYLILHLFGLDIVNYCLMQSDLNALADK